MNLKIIEKYNKLWKAKKINKPIVLLMGGYAGTGKSTLVSSLDSYFPYINLLPTGIIRSVLRRYIKEEDNPYLYTHTYKLDKILSSDKKKEGIEKIVDNYIKQVKPIALSINEIINFASSERQHWILDGNHILPQFVHENNKVILIELYLKVSDPEQHYKMINGPTHARGISKHEFDVGRTIHDYIVHVAEEHSKPLFEYNVAQKDVPIYIENIINKKIKENG